MARKYTNKMREKLREKCEYRRSEIGRYMAFMGKASIFGMSTTRSKNNTSADDGPE